MILIKRQNLILLQLQIKEYTLNYLNKNIELLLKSDSKK